MNNKIEVPRTMTEVMQDIDYSIQLLNFSSVVLNETDKKVFKDAIQTDILQLRSQLLNVEDAIIKDNIDLALQITRPNRITRKVSE